MTRILILYCWNHSALGYLWQLTRVSISRQDNQPCQENRKRRESPGRKSCPRQNSPPRQPCFLKGHEDERFEKRGKTCQAPICPYFSSIVTLIVFAHWNTTCFGELFFNNFSNKTWVKGGRMIIFCYSPPHCLAPFPSCWNKSEKFPSFFFIHALWMSVQNWIWLYF